MGCSLQRHQPGLTDGLLLLCPGFYPQVKLPLNEQLAVFRKRTQLVPIPLNDPDLFTSSDEWQRYIADEPHGLREATARFLFSSFALDVYLRRAAKRVLEGMSAIYKIVREAFDGIRAVKGFTREPRERRRFREATEEYYRKPPFPPVEA